MGDATFKLDELARAAGTSARTVRYYVQRGLLPAPEFHGKDTAYGPGHLARLRAIRRLQERYLPLDAIQAELADRTPAQIERLAQGLDLPDEKPEPPPPAPGAPVLDAPGPDARAPAPQERWRRFLLAPGLELWLEDRADEDVQGLAYALAGCLHRAPQREVDALAKLLSERMLQRREERR